jgi:hypothetical protein
VTTSPTEPSRCCAECGAAIPSGAERCWLCHGQALAGGGRPAPPAQAARRESRTAWQFSIATLLILMTVTAVLFGVGEMSPGLAGALAVLVVPALAATAVSAARLRSHGVELTLSEKVSLFAGKLAVVLAITGLLIVAALVVLAARCFGF